MTDLAEMDVRPRLTDLRDELLRTREYLLDTPSGIRAVQSEDHQTDLDASKVGERQAHELLTTLRQRRTLAQIDAALDRFDDGSYGTCTDCSRPIPAERLEAMPSAGRCLDCQYKREISRTDHDDV